VTRGQVDRSFLVEDVFRIGDRLVKGSSPGSEDFHAVFKDDPAKTYILDNGKPAVELSFNFRSL
jgi:hypothetical protein